MTRRRRNLDAPGFGDYTAVFIEQRNMAIFFLFTVKAQEWSFDFTDRFVEMAQFGSLPREVQEDIPQFPKDRPILVWSLPGVTYAMMGQISTDARAHGLVMGRSIAPEEWQGEDL